ncbi:MAG: hypothetical protein R3C25_06480 [Hyphomonadaceae bacterium]
MRHFLKPAAAAAALLAGCSQPAPSQAPQQPEVPPAIEACNSVTPDAARQIAVTDEVASTAAAADLRGGRIAPGTYDLIAATRIGAATGWRGTRAVALEVSEDADNGVAFNWAGAAPGGETDRWTASFSEEPSPHMTYRCGRMGDVPVAFAVEGAALQLRLTDGAGGSLALTFQPRA